MNTPNSTNTTNAANISEMKSVVLLTDQLDTTAAFYRDVLQLPLESEQHRGTARHFACQLGAQHFAIHERATFWLPVAANPAPPGTIVSFTVADLDAFGERLRGLGVPIIARQNIGPMKFVALRDPDGRHVCCGTPWPSPAS